MYVEDIELKNFRNYKSLNLNFNRDVNIFIGDNAQGKTNILEGIYYCSLCKSHRTNKDRELINLEADSSNITLNIEKGSMKKKIEIKIFKEGKKGIKINSIKVKKISDLIGVFNVVMFSPEDLRIIKDSPSCRRKFIDIELCKLSDRYYYNLVSYNKVLSERNTTLKNSSFLNNDIMDVFERQLAKFGAYITKQRSDYINKLNLYGSKIHSRITKNREEIKFKYITGVKDMNNVENELIAGLKRSRKTDIERRYTNFGPHKDDFEVLINDEDVKNFGSQGQQRTSVLSIKFASINIIKDITGEYPVLLLDDVLSELDSGRQKFVLNSLNQIQTFITCTGVGNILEILNKKASVFLVNDGKVIKTI